MGKRSDFKRKPRDFYPTPFAAVEPLIEHLPRKFTFSEPCAGDGQLCRHLEYFGGVCIWASDIEPQLAGIAKNDFSEIGDFEIMESGFIITNPPWDRTILHPIIEHFAPQRPTWLLFDADWVHTKESIPYIKYLHKIVSTSQISSGGRPCAWHLFDAQTPPIMGVIFHGRAS